MIIYEHRNKSDDKTASQLFHLSYRAVKYVRHYCSLCTNRVNESVVQASKGELTGSMECIAGSVGLLRLSSENRRLTKDTLTVTKGLIEYVCYDNYEELDLSSAKEVCELLEIAVGDPDALLRMTEEETADQWENLEGCDQITDTGLVSLRLAAGCPDITTLDLDSCDQITDTGLASLAAGCTAITTLDLSKCDQITNTGLASLATKFPSIEITK